MSRLRTAALSALCLLAAAACGGRDSTQPSTACSTSNDPLRVGQVAILDTGKVAACAFLADEGGAAEYLAVPFTASFEQNVNVVVTVDGSRVSFEAAAAPSTSAPAAYAFHSRLRAFETRVAERGLSPASSSGARLFAPTVGQVDSFWVITSQALDNLDRAFENPQPGDFQRVGATLKFMGTRTLLYVDDESPPPDSLTDAEVQEMGQIFDTKLYPLGVQTFGTPSDVNADGRVSILLSPYVNALTPKRDSAIIVGFFFPLDLFDTGTANCPICAFSNEQEIFYGIVPDTGVFSGRRPKDRVKAILPPIMVHEFQHMISFNQRVFVRGGLPEVLWLNEALSHIAEEMGGDLFAAGGDNVRADDFYEQNFLRTIFYLEEPWTTTLTATQGGGTLEERGAGWLFLRWLGDQYGNDIYGRLVRTTDRGSVNVEKRTGTRFFLLFGEWAITLYSEDLTIPNLSDRYQVKKWALRSILRSGGQYALQPIARTFSEIRSSGVTQTLKGTSPYPILVSADGSGSLTLSLDLAGAGGLALLRTE